MKAKKSVKNNQLDIQFDKKAITPEQSFSNTGSFKKEAKQVFFDPREHLYQKILNRKME